MSYTALYRKFRPDNFEDVKGQDHIVTTLTNQIKAWIMRIGSAKSVFWVQKSNARQTIRRIHYSKTLEN